MKYIKFFKLGLIILALIISPLISFAQYDTSDFDDFANNPPSGPDDPSNSGNNSSSGSSNTASCELAANPKFDSLINYISCIISTSIIPLIFVLAFALFLWGVVQYIMNNEEEAKREKGKQFMLWGIIALFVMFSVWGLIKVLGNTFGIQYVIPQVAD